MINVDHYPSTKPIKPTGSKSFNIHDSGKIKIKIKNIK